MKTNKISIAMFVVLLSTLVFTSTVFSAAPVKEPKEPPLEKEHKFEPFDRRKMKKDKPAYSNSDEIKMSKNGRVISTGTELVFFDDMGNISKRKPIKNGMITEFSPDGTRMSQNIATVIGEKDVDKSLFRMLDENGDLIWEEDDLAYADGYWVSQANGGVVVISACGEGGCGRDFELYEVESQERKVIRPDVDENAHRGYFAMSDDGNYFAAGYYDFDPSVAYFDISGKQLWVKHFENQERLTGSMGISASGNYVIITTRSYINKISYIYIYNKQGELLLKDVRGCGNCSYSFDRSETFAVMLGTDGFYVYDLKNPKLIVDITHNSPNMILFESVDVSDDLIAIGASYYSADKPKYFYLYNMNGDLLYKKKIIAQGIRDYGKPQVKIIDSGRRVVVKLGDKVQVYKNEFAK